jgi:F-type H+-transporting ATPase subunit epsilon
MAMAIGQFRCVVVTPERTVLDREADFVALPLYDGELGVMKDRTPLIARLGYGELRWRSGAATERFYVDGGFLQIKKNLVSVLTPRAMPAREIDAQQAEEELQAALRLVPTTTDAFVAKQKALARGRAQVALARKVGAGS